MTNRQKYLAPGGIMSIMTNHTNLVFVNVPGWQHDQVANWLRGLDDVILPYVHCFLNAEIGGSRLLCLTRYDLEKMNITKVGHQELILEAVELLSSLSHELESETMQSIALQVSCKATCLHNVLKAQLAVEPDKHKRLPLNVLADISDCICSIKTMVSWLDRSPFDVADCYKKLRNAVVKHGLSITQAVHNDNARAAIMTSCRSLADLCDGLIQSSKDPLVIQPASLEMAVIRKKPDEELGMHIQSSYNGTHAIGGIKMDSPADLCGKIEEGDEVIQVNYQTVLGWQLKKLVTALKDNAKEVTLTLKKRPYHSHQFGPQTNKRSAAKNLKQSTFPKALRRKSGDSQKGMRSSLKDFLNTVPPPTGEVLSDTPRENNTDNEAEEVFQEGHPSPAFHPVESKHRRATVSGGSPTVKRPSIMISQFSAGRPKSFTVSSPSSEGSHGSMGSPGNEVTSPDDNKLKVSDAYELSPMIAAKGSMSVTPSISLSDGSSLLPSFEYNSGHAANSAHRRKASEVASREIPGSEVKGSPQLMRLTRIDSNRRAELSERDRSNSVDSIDRPPASDLEELDLCSNLAQSYTVNIVGGVAQKVPTSKDPRDSPTLQSPTNSLLRRMKGTGRRFGGANRRVSCKDLGGGDCQGWLWKKKEGHGLRQGKWVKRWFVLKQHNLYYYKDPEDQKAAGLIHLPGFQISPAPEIKSKKFAFKSHHPGTTFYFAAERQPDLAKWMNKMGLAAIALDTSHMASIAGFKVHDPNLPGMDAAYYSQSESEEEDNTTPSQSSPGSPMSTRTRSPPSEPSSDSKSLSTSLHLIDTDESCSEGACAPDPDDLLRRPSHGELHHLYRNIRSANLNIDGIDIHDRRASTMAPTVRLHIRHSDELHLGRRLASLQRTLKDKEQELMTIEDMLMKEIVLASDLHSFSERHPSVRKRRAGEPSSESPSDEEFEA
ncbi:hypothetical protein CAPTEDRAFT_221602 [Capitella teleta]|uniref:Uncharacterized protein n=1 Tax=Capitella teleta TaxID=283909 RepID=R7V6R6_CAPTE|nr:hypothetical protein CAPTEDRAFT_221602 [Capitella teleta]|eukprot:ELU11460.1 hypothetical protein CAPTEDRAFT_221602 [Capitella teleta]